MNQLILQIIIRQWDKSQMTKEAIRAREILPNRYPVKMPPAKLLFDGRIIIDQHGDDLLANRLQYQRLENDLLIDRFRFNLINQTVEFKTQLTSDMPPVQLSEITNGWQQFHYQWRYRVEHQDQLFWLYESVILNAAYSADFDEERFVKSLPEQRFYNLLNEVS